MPTSITVSSESMESEQNQNVNAFIRKGLGRLPRNLENNPVVQAMFQHEQNEDQNGGE